MARSKRVREALKHRNVLGAGAKKRRKLAATENAEAIMAEFHRGTLHSGTGAVVKSEAQARAIIRSTNKGRRKKLHSKRFGRPI